MKFLLWLKKYWWIVMIGVVIGILIYRSAEKKKEAEIKDKTYVVTKKDLIDSLSITGEIDATEKVSLRFQTSGLLTWVGVKEGDQVKKFQTIASLDKRELQNSMTTYLNSYTKAREDFEQAQSDNKDWQTRGMTDEAREAIKRSLSKEQMDLNNSVLALEAKALALKFSNLYTPIEGIVTQVDSPLAGQNITPASATFEVVNPKTLFFSAVADQTEVTKFSEGVEGIVTLDSFPDRKVTGKVTSIGYTPKTGETGTVYELKIGLADLATREASLRLGMTGEVEFVFSKLENVVAVPSAYVKKENGKHFVTIFENNKTEKREVEIGKEIDGNIEIKAGLKENEILYSN